jgi:hypothetical protein
MTVRRLLAGKQAGGAVIPQGVRVQDVINQLETEDVSALVVSDDGRRIWGSFQQGISCAG